jgi:hypothetical protein
MGRIGVDHLLECLQHLDHAGLSAEALLIGLSDPGET